MKLQWNFILKCINKESKCFPKELEGRYDADFEIRLLIYEYVEVKSFSFCNL